MLLSCQIAKMKLMKLNEVDNMKVAKLPNIELLSCQVAKLPSCQVAKLPSCQVAKLLSCHIAKLPNYLYRIKFTKLNTCKINMTNLKIDMTSKS